METFTFNADGDFNGNSDNVTFAKNTYTCEYVATVLLPHMFGTTIANGQLTYGQLDIITKMYNHGWTLMPSFSKNYTKEGGMVITPVLNTFMIWCDVDGTVTQFVCFVEYFSNKVTLYDTKHKLATYESVDIMLEYMPQLSKTEPLVCCGYSDDFVADCMSKFSKLGFEDGIFSPESDVYGDMDMSRCIFFLDKSRCHEVKITTD